MRTRIIRDINGPRRSLPKQSAQALVEFVIALPIVLLIAIGLLELGRLLFTYISVYTASREAARYGSAVGVAENGVAKYQDCVGMRAAAKRVGVMAGLSDSQIDLRYDSGPEDPRAWTDLPTCPAAVPAGGRIAVRVTGYFKTAAGFVNIPSMTLISDTARTIVQDVSVEGIPPTPTPMPTLTPTRTATQIPTATLTFTPTPTDTPTSTVTPTSTITPTITPGPSSTATFTQTLTPTETGTPTRTPTSTKCPLSVCTPTPTATATATSTPTPTATPDCTGLSYGVPSSNSSKFTFQLFNNSVYTRTITLISIAWNGNGTVQSVYLLPSQLWTDSAGVISPHVFTQGDWITGSNRSVAPNAPRDLTFDFDNASHQDHDATVVYDNGCVIKPPITR